MRNALSVAICSALFAAQSACGGSLTLLPMETEVVIAQDAPSTVRFAAEEMTNFLSRAFGQGVRIVTAPTAGKSCIYLGENDWTRKAGIDTAALKRDAFALVVQDGSVYIAGRDDRTVDFHEAIHSPRAGVWNLLNEHATLFGVYEFLERYAHVRMYFPGELGTIIPRQSSIAVRTGRWTVAPDYSIRNYSWWADGVYFEGTNRTCSTLAERKLNYVRNRMQTPHISCCHGSNGFRILKRFGKTHPEYLALFQRNGKLIRDLDPKERFHHPGQICHSSAVYDEMFKDICSYARGEGPEVRGMGSWKDDGRRQQDWDQGTFQGQWVDIMPQDGMIPCQCASCQKVYNTNEFHYATELIWGRTVELANRLKEAGVGLHITQMAYTPYRRIPDIDIPDNVDVMVAEGGPWSILDKKALATEYSEIGGWAKKLDRPVWTWTYVGKYGPLQLPDIPDGTPRAWGKYYARIAPWVFGCYAESGGDRAFYNYLSYYVLGKVSWNTKTDVDALLDEYFRLMFGPAAKDMEVFVDDTERRWLKGVCCRSVETPVGPQRVAPSPYDLHMKIYSPETLAKWDSLLGSAAAKVPVGSLAARRIALYRQEFYDPLLRAGREFRNLISVKREIAYRACHPTNRNLLVNGDFSLTERCGSDRHFGLWEDGAGHGWRGGWIAGEGCGPCISFGDDIPKGASGKAMKLTGNGECISVRNYFTHLNGRLKPGVRYRVSYFVRLTNVVPLAKRRAGVCMRVWCDHNTFFPKNDMTGTTDWIHQAFEFVAGPKSAEYESAFEVCLRNSTGSVEYADLRLDEIAGD